MQSSEFQLRQWLGAFSLLQTNHWGEPQHPCVCRLQQLVHKHGRGGQQATGNVQGECQTPSYFQVPVVTEEKRRGR